MISPANFPDWQFEFSTRSIINERRIFNFKSPRMVYAHHYNPVLQENSDDALREYEKECYLNQVMFNVATQIQTLQTDIRRQLQLHINRGLPLPSELKACVDLKIV